MNLGWCEECMERAPVDGRTLCARCELDFTADRSYRDGIETGKRECAEYLDSIGYVGNNGQDAFAVLGVKRTADKPSEHRETK